MNSYDDDYDTLVQNGMFRNRDPPDLAKPISGSDADFIYDDAEQKEYAKMLGLELARVEVR